ncbi:MAG: carbon-nitrogen hydrolase family protein [Epsilonproteobacteria bacterium]|nr:carbon-nitrogen hydrolase family protein [Campylobacterota bacterium]
MSYLSKQEYSIALLQLETTNSYQKNLTKLIKYINSNLDKDLIIAPEVYLTGYDYENFDKAAEFYNEAIDAILPLIDKQILVFTIIRNEKGSSLNQATVIHNHKIVYKQNKYKLFKLGNEDKYFKAGDKNMIQPFEINGIRYGLIICFELRFKDLWKQLEDVDIILIPAMWGKPRKTHLEVLSRALAIMNQCFVVVCNSANEDMAKSSAIIRPWGEVVMDDKAEIIEYIANLKEVKKVRRLINMN